MKTFSRIETRASKQSVGFLRAAAFAVVLGSVALALEAGEANALTLFDIKTANTIDVDDKRFTNWSYSGIIDDDVAKTIDVTLLAGDPLNPGFRFSTPSGIPLTSGPNSSSTFNIGFNVNVFTGEALIKDISLEVVSASFPGDCTLPDCGAIFELIDGGGPLGPLLSFNNVGLKGFDVAQVNGITGFNLMGTLATNALSQVDLRTWDLRFSQTPEPGSAALFAANFGLVGLLLHRRRRAA